MSVKFPRTVWLLGFISLLADISGELLYPVLPVYLQQAGYSMLALGLLEGFANVVAGLSKGYFGHRSDLHQQRSPFIRLGYGLSACGKLLMLGMPDLLRVYVARGVDRLGKGVRTAPRDALLAASVPPENRASVFGFHRALDTLGAAIGPLLALVLLYFYPGNYTLIFTVACIPALLSWLLTFTVRDSRKEVSGSKNGMPGLLSYLRYWTNAQPSYRKLLAPLVLFAAVNSPDVFLLLALKAEGLSDLHMVFAYTLYNLAYALLAWPVGLLADRYGRGQVLSAGLMLFALVYAGMALSNTIGLFALLFLFYALAISCIEPLVKALITMYAPVEERGQAIGFYTSMNSLAVLFAGVWTGWVWQAFGPGTAFAITSAGTLCALLLFLYRKGNGG